jgi:hypothetical protein
VAMPVAVEAKPLPHMLNTCFFVKVVHIHSVIILTLGFGI